MGVSIEIDNVTKAYQNNIVIEGLKPPVNDIDETKEFYEMAGEEPPKDAE